MCLAIPGKIITIQDDVDEVFRTAKVSFDGIIKTVNLSMVPEAKEGNFILVHVGSAISIVDEQEANKTMEILKQMDTGDLSELQKSD